MDWIQVITIIASLGGIMFFLVNKIDSDVKSIGNRLDGHAQRIDQIYKMYCETQNEIKQLHIDFITKDNK